MADFNFLEVLSELERGIKGVFKLPDGSVIYADTPDQFRARFKDYVDYKFRLLSHAGDNMSFAIVKGLPPDSTPVQRDYKDPMASPFSKDILSEKKVQFILDVAVGIAAKKGLSGDELDAVRGYVISKLNSLDGRIKKYYGDNWEKFLSRDSIVEKFIVNFLKKYLNSGIDEIVSVYKNGLVSKSNYMNRNAGMTHMMNVNYVPVVQDQDAIIDTAEGGDEADSKSDPYRREFNRLNDKKQKRKAPEGLYHESDSNQKLKY